MTDRTDRELIDSLATKVMGWRKVPDPQTQNEWWTDAMGIHGYALVGKWNPLLNPNDCAGLMEKCKVWKLSRWLDGSCYAWVDYEYHATAATWTRAFCLAVQAEWEAKDV